MWAEIVPLYRGDKLVKRNDECPSEQRSRVLVVDDDERIRSTLARLLLQLGHDVEEASDGRAALSRLRESTYGFDLVLCDMEMPHMDGTAFLQHVKGDPSLSCRIVMVSAVDDVAHIASCIEQGADDFLTKPFSRVLLEARIASSLARKRADDWQQRYLALVEEEKQQSQRLIASMLPDTIAERLRQGEGTIADQFDDVAILFADIVGFTQLASVLPAVELVARLNAVFSRFDDLVTWAGLEKIKTIGDAYMVGGGIPEPHERHCHAIAQLGLDMVVEAKQCGDLDLRVGIHCGPAVAGVIGATKPTYDVWGDTVNRAQRMESHGVPGRVHVSDAFRRRVADEFVFAPRGELDIKGCGRIETHFLLG